ncbi:MAG: hypothetical protein AB4290_04995 [Spirulina sp.]
MIKSATNIWLYFFFPNVVFWLLLISLRIHGYGLRGYYTNLMFAILSFGLGLITANARHSAPRHESIIYRQLGKWQENLFRGILVINMMASTVTIFAFLVYQLSGFASSGCMQEFTSPSGRTIVIKSCGLTCYYSLHQNHFLVTEVEAFAEISPEIIGKCLGDRFRNLKLEWNQSETEIDWQITNYNTTSGINTNPTPPITGKVLVK